MTDREVLYSIDGHVGTITLNRPDKLNAFEERMRDALGEVIDAAVGDDRVRVVVIAGAGGASCAGADLGCLREIIARDNWAAARALIDLGGSVVTAIRVTGKPIIAAVNTPAAGGGANLALTCDLRLASDRTAGQAFNRIGLQPDWSGSYFLLRLVGHAKALELIFTGDMVDDAEGLRSGPFNLVVPHDRLVDETREFAARLSAKPSLALAVAKQSIHDSAHATLPAMIERESQNQLKVFRTEDAREGVNAFNEKRPLSFAESEQCNGSPS